MNGEEAEAGVAGPASLDLWAGETALQPWAGRAWAAAWTLTLEPFDPVILSFCI